MQVSTFSRIIVVAAMFFLAACNDEGPEINNGNFLDSAVEGLIYRTASLEGITNSDGLFQFEDGETVTFFVGDIALPSAPARSVMTPLDLAETTDVNDPAANNIARLLQSIDQDGNPDNGITITLATRNAADGLSVSDWADTTNFVAEIAELTTDLITAEEAASHLSETIDGLSGEESTVQLASIPDQSVEWLAAASLHSSVPGNLYIGESQENLVSVMRWDEEGDSIYAEFEIDALPRTLNADDALYFLYVKADESIDLRNLTWYLSSNEVVGAQSPDAISPGSATSYVPATLSPTGQALLVYYDEQRQMVRVLELQ